MSGRWLCRLLENFLRLVTIPAHHHRPDDAAVLLASATAASLVGLRASSARTHSPSRVGRLRAWRSTATAPAVSRLRMYLSPRLLVRPKRSLPPLEFCRGVIPSQAANSRPDRNTEGSATVAAIALAPMMPIPGTVAKMASIIPVNGSSFRRAG